MRLVFDISTVAANMVILLGEKYAVTCVNLNQGDAVLLKSLTRPTKFEDEHFEYFEFRKS